MFDKVAWSKSYDLERREWYKAKGICYRCGQSFARPGKVLCAPCAKSIYDRRERRDPGRKREAEIVKRRSEAWYEMGMCKRCGKRTHREGRMTCTVCAKKQREKDIMRGIRRRLELEKGGADACGNTRRG